MEKTSEILNELQAISPLLANIDKKNVYEVPEGYFKLLDKRITTTVLIYGDKRSETQRVPEGYFEGLSNKILSTIKNTEDPKEEIKDTSHFLFSLKDKNTFTVPDHYFENLSDNIFSKISTKKAKVVSINSNKRWWRYAAAAIIACIIMIGALQLFNEKSSSGKGDKFSLASANVPDYIKLSFQYKTPEQLKNGIASLSDADIVNYLEQHGNVLDDDSISSNIDTTGLPDATDYLINDNTLNNFLEIDSDKTQGE